jgi:hypothetical protein
MKLRANDIQVTEIYKNVCKVTYKETENNRNYWHDLLFHNQTADEKKSVNTIVSTYENHQRHVYKIQFYR